MVSVMSDIKGNAQIKINIEVHGLQAAVWCLSHVFFSCLYQGHQLVYTNGHMR